MASSSQLLLGLVWQDEDLIGPAVPPLDSDAEDGDAWDGRGPGEADEEADPYRLPVTSEVALEGTCMAWQCPLSSCF